MPKNERYVDVRIFADGRATTATGERPFYREMDVIELPPHGDLIDRDALKVDFLDRGIEGIQMDDFSELQQTIDDAPTVIEASEVE